MRELASIGAETGLDDTFEDINQLAENCRFSDCTHTIEPECSVIEALKNGEIEREHYDNYIKLREESKSNKETYLKRRKKVKDPGRVTRDQKKTQGRK